LKVSCLQTARLLEDFEDEFLKVSCRQTRLFEEDFEDLVLEGVLPAAARILEEDFEDLVLEGALPADRAHTGGVRGFSS